MKHIKMFENFKSYSEGDYDALAQKAGNTMMNAGNFAGVTGKVFVVDVSGSIPPSGMRSICNSINSKLKEGEIGLLITNADRIDSVDMISNSGLADTAEEILMGSRIRGGGTSFSDLNSYLSTDVPAMADIYLYTDEIGAEQARMEMPQLSRRIKFEII